jgi:hypothetical protein
VYCRDEGQLAQKSVKRMSSDPRLKYRCPLNRGFAKRRQPTSRKWPPSYDEWCMGRAHEQPAARRSRKNLLTAGECLQRASALSLASFCSSRQQMSRAQEADKPRSFATTRNARFIRAPSPGSLPSRSRRPPVLAMAVGRCTKESDAYEARFSRAGLRR